MSANIHLLDFKLNIKNCYELKSGQFCKHCTEFNFLVDNNSNQKLNLSKKPSE